MWLSFIVLLGFSTCEYILGDKQVLAITKLVG